MRVRALFASGPLMNDEHLRIADSRGPVLKTSREMFEWGEAARTC
jgi:hypothetical protein